MLPETEPFSPSYEKKDHCCLQMKILCAYPEKNTVLLVVILLRWGGFFLHQYQLLLIWWRPHLLFAMQFSAWLLKCKLHRVHLVLFTYNWIKNCRLNDFVDLISRIGIDPGWIIYRIHQSLEWSYWFHLVFCKDH